MLPMFNMKQFASHYQTIANSLAKMKKNDLTLEDILKEEDLVNEIKNNHSSQLNDLKLIDYATKIPENDEFDKGYKFPYNACEILSSESNVILELIMMKKGDEYKKIQESDSIGEVQRELVESNTDLFGNQDNNMKDVKDQVLNNKEEEKGDFMPIKLDNEGFKSELRPEDDDNKIIDVTDDVAIMQNNLKENDIKEEGIIKNEEENIQPKEDSHIQPEEQTQIKTEAGHKHLQLDEAMMNEDNDNQDDIVTYQSPKNEEIEYVNLDYLFEFLKTTEASSNHVLVGYFNKIFSNLLEKKGNIILPYIFKSSNDFLDNLIKKLNRHMIGDCVGKILTFSNDNCVPLYNQKILFLNKVLQALYDTTDEDTCEIICSTLVSCMSTKQVFQLLISKDNLFLSLFKAIENNINNTFNLQSIYGLLIKICNTSLKGFSTLVTKDKTSELFPEAKIIQSNPFQSSFLDETEEKEAKLIFGDTIESNQENLLFLLDSLFKALFNSLLIIFKDMDKDNEQMFIEETTYVFKQNRLGMHKLTQAELFKSIINLIINAYAKDFLKEQIDVLLKEIISKRIFNTLIELFFKYEFNNLYQTLFGQILEFTFNEYSPQCLIDHLLKEEKIIERIKVNILNKRRFAYESERTINSCLFAFEINFFDEIISSPNQQVQAFLIEDQEFQVFNTIYLNDLISIFKGKLCQLEKESFSFNQQSPSKEIDNIAKPINKCQDISLNELILANMQIYEVYKEGGDYQTLLEAKRQREELIRKQSENIIENLNRTNEDMIFNQRDDFNDGGEFIDDNRVIDTEGLSDYKQIEEKDYYDHNYWNKTEMNDKEKNDLENCLNDL